MYFTLNASAPDKPLPWEIPFDGGTLQLLNAQGAIVSGTARMNVGGSVDFTVWAEGEGAFPLSLRNKTVLLIGDSSVWGLLLKTDETLAAQLNQFGITRFDQIQAEALSFAQRVRKLHDAELLAGGSENDPHFAGANPTVYTNLLLQNYSLRAGDEGVRLTPSFLLSQSAVASLWGAPHSKIFAPARSASTGPRHGPNRGQVVSDLRKVARGF